MRRLPKDPRVGTTVASLCQNVRWVVCAGDLGNPDVLVANLRLDPQLPNGQVLVFTYA